MSIPRRDDDPVPKEAFGDDVIVEPTGPGVVHHVSQATVSVRTATASLLTGVDKDGPDYERDNHE